MTTEEKFNYPFQSGWTEGQVLLLALSIMVTVGMGSLVAAVFLDQFFLALFFALAGFYLNFKLRLIQKRFEEIGAS